MLLYNDYTTLQENNVNEIWLYEIHKFISHHPYVCLNEYYEFAAGVSSLISVAF